MSEGSDVFFLGLKINTLGIFGGIEICHVFFRSYIFFGRKLMPVIFWGIKFQAHVFFGAPSDPASCTLRVPPWVTQKLPVELLLN